LERRFIEDSELALRREAYIEEAELATRNEEICKKLRQRWRFPPFLSEMSLISVTLSL
jgi:hypothetical protein